MALYKWSTSITLYPYVEKRNYPAQKEPLPSFFPVLLMDWAEGITLDTYLKTHLHDCYAL